jgi:Domain of Unknown Function (DUF1080)
MIAVFFVFFLLASVSGQTRRDISKRNVCGAFGPITDKTIYEWETDPDDKARRYVELICEEEAITPNFKIMRASISNAMSTRDEYNSRYIYYSLNFFQNNNNKWGLIAVLAHEIGHHINNDPINNDSLAVNTHRREDELHADQFAGKVICRMHGSLKDAKLLMDQNCSTLETSLYPSKEARLEALSNGYENAGCHFEDDAGPDLSSTLNALTDAEARQGWKLLFDGKRIAGWHTYGKESNDGTWDVQDNALHVAGGQSNPGGSKDLVSDEVYGDFDLKLEWKIAPGGNSGVIFYVQEGTGSSPSSTGLEMQILDDLGNPNGQQAKRRAGDLYDLIACSKTIVKQPGEWNQIEIYSRGGELKLYQNGMEVLAATLWDDNWKTLIANSDLRELSVAPGFGNFRRGKIDLQNHGQEVWFRNIKIKTLSTPRTTPSTIPRSRN